MGKWKPTNITLNLAPIVGFLICLFLIIWGDQIQKWIGWAGLIYLSNTA